MGWSKDKDFVAWLKSTDPDLAIGWPPYVEETLDLMYEAWKAGKEHGAKILVARDINTVNM